MPDGIYGRKVGMTQVFDPEGNFVPVTIIDVSGEVVVREKTLDKDGYAAFQLGFGQTNKKRLVKPVADYLEKHKVKPVKHIREVKPDNPQHYKVGEAVAAEAIFAPGDTVDVIGTSIGKGFQGVVKRHHFRGGPETHGSMFHRAPGSVGSSSFPSRTFKGIRMGGHMGNKRVTVKNLKVVEIIAASQTVLIRGAVPGSPDGLVMIRKVGK